MSNDVIFVEGGARPYYASEVSGYYPIGTNQPESKFGTYYYDRDGRPAWIENDHWGGDPFHIGAHFVPDTLIPTQDIYWNLNNTSALPDGAIPLNDGQLYNIFGVPYVDKNGYWLTSEAPAMYADSHPFIANDAIRSDKKISYALSQVPYDDSGDIRDISMRSVFVDLVKQALVPYLYPPVSAMPSVPDDYTIQLHRGSY